MASRPRGPRRSPRSRRPAARRARPPRLPLEGYRVVEMAHHLSAPLAGMHLGDFGADVVKVEGPEGEDWRRWGRPSRSGDSQLFLAINRNKRSLAVDLSRPEGRVVIERLLGSTDVLLTNYAPGVLRELGLRPRQGLVQVVVGVDETGRDKRASEPHGRVGTRRRAASDAGTPV